MSWEQLKAILRENRTALAEERRRPPQVCPYDGSALVYNAARGLLGCPMGDYIAPGRPDDGS